LDLTTVRILHIVQRYRPAQGGAELLMEKLSTHLAQAGHQVVVATTDALDFELFWDPTRRRIPERTDVFDGVQVRRFPVRHLPLPGLSYPGTRRLLAELSRLSFVPPGVLMRLARITPWVPALHRWVDSATETFDIVAAMTITFEPLLEAGLRLARRQGIPFVCYPLTHLGAGAEPGRDALSRYYTMRHQVNLVLASDGVVAQTPAERDYYLRRGQPDERIVVSGPGVTPSDVIGGDGERFKGNYGVKGSMVLSIGAMSGDKGTVHTVEALRKLWRDGEQAELVLIGAVLRPFRQYLQGVPAAERARIHLLGPVSEQDKRDALAAASMLVMPSRTDSFGIVYLEAWLNGLPVVGARTWGVMDVISDGDDGILVPFGDVEALSIAIQRLLTDPEEAAVMGAKGRAKVLAHHLWPQKFAVVESLYRRLATGSAA
jgi:glycogen synthase